MLVIWRGFGWTIPIIVFASFLGTQLLLNEIYGAGYYESSEWPKVFAVAFASVLIGGLGYLLNYRKRFAITDEETGEEKKSPSHTLFFVPVEFWAVILPVLFFWMQSFSAEQEAEDLVYLRSPAVNDRYHVDLTKIFEDTDKTYKFGLMKVTNISDQGIEVLISEVAYDRKSGVRKDIREGKHNDAAYFSEEPVAFALDELMHLKENDAIYSVSRNKI